MEGLHAILNARCQHILGGSRETWRAPELNKKVGLNLFKNPVQHYWLSTLLLNIVTTFFLQKSEKHRGKQTHSWDIVLYKYRRAWGKDKWCLTSILFWQLVQSYPHTLVMDSQTPHFTTDWMCGWNCLPAAALRSTKHTIIFPFVITLASPLRMSSLTVGVFLTCC